MNNEAFAVESPNPPPDMDELTARIEGLEREQRQLRRDALLIAGLTTIAAALAIATMVENRMMPRTEIVQPVGNHRVVSAQGFLLTDTQGRPRAKLTFE